ncbi:MAG: hypothetical protein ABSA07_06270 [Acidimicrobiales bacterium]
MNPTDREIGEHLLACYDTIYIVLGESAPTFTNDAYVVRAYEMARAHGELALELREHLGDVDVAAPPVLEDVLRRAVAGDDTGALVLYAMAMVVGPRLLVSLLDARTSLSGDDEMARLFAEASMVCVKEIRATGEVAKDQAPIEDERWQDLARGLSESFDAAGNAESLGISR